MARPACSGVEFEDRRASGADRAACMVNEPVNDAPAGGFAVRRASFVRVPQVLAMAVVALMGRLRARAGAGHPRVERQANLVGDSSPEKSGPSP